MIISMTPLNPLSTIHVIGLLGYQALPPRLSRYIYNLTPGDIVISIQVAQRLVINFMAVFLLLLLPLSVCYSADEVADVTKAIKPEYTNSPHSYDGGSIDANKPQQPEPNNIIDRNKDIAIPLKNTTVQVTSPGHVVGPRPSE